MLVHEIFEGVVAFRKAVPDIGTLFSYEGDDYLLAGWYKRAPEIEDDPDYIPGDVNDLLDDAVWANLRPIRIGDETVKLVRSRRDDAEFVSGKGVGFCFAPVAGIRITGQFQGDPEMLASLRRRAIMKVGEPVT